MSIRHSQMLQRLFMVLLAALLIPGCAILPSRPDLPFEPALPPASDGQLAELSARFQEKEGADTSGFRLLINARKALEARLALVDLATRSIDLQYFIWQGDASGTLLFDRLLQAADRGVKVRIIVDDIGLASSTRDLSAVNLHPNLEIRIFNPNPSRDYTLGGALNFLASFKELNRRMHNKLMIVDNHVAIAGGRNIGNEYFGLGTKYNFIDIDVLAVGAVLEESSHAFDEYWNNTAVYPVSIFEALLPENTYEEMRQVVTEILAGYAPRLSSYPLQPADWQHWLAELELQLDTGEAHLLQDDPVQIDGRDYRLVDMIAYFSEPAEHEFILSTPYLIPVGDFLKVVQEKVAEGLRVRILTNSLSSTNHTLVNSHYNKYRLPILKTGAELHEFRHQPTPLLRAQADVAPIEAPFVSLHAKVLVSDRRRCFIGSLNFDPRALVINSENGLLIESPALAEKLADFLEKMMEPENGWNLVLTGDNSIEWQSGDTILTGQPSRGFFQSMADFFGRLLPVESQL